ncbi:MAG: histidine--tRNA ligase [Chloroflexi bacterium]|nr:histidine--tRNA ligase [Chloroflexota bacterium]
MAFKTPRGTNDILPEDQAYWSYVWGTAEQVAASFGFGRIDTPMFEDTSLFRHGVGEETDIVEKEMYSFDDLGGDNITLKPEGTAPVCRAYIQHGMSNLPQPVRLFYENPHFRYERPQAGRVRQHHQFGVEIIGDPSPQVDAEIIELGWTYLSSLGLKNLSLKINSIGDGACRPTYLELLNAHLEHYEDSLCDDHRKRYKVNPLRVLDCKKPGCQSVSVNAPASVDHLCDDCREHFELLKGTLDDLVAAGALIPYTVDNRLVRGLDYYNRTVFEFEPADVKGQSTILAGGRYDPLIEILGGKPTPGIGFGSGVERVILNLKAQGIEVPEARTLDLICVHIGDNARRRLVTLAATLRAAGKSVIVAPEGRSMKSQMRYANNSGARYALILGDRDLEQGEATLRPLIGDGKEVQVGLDAAVIAAEMV